MIKRLQEQIKTLFHSYLSGDSLATAAKKAGIKAFHAGIGRMLRITRYLGGDYYPAIIDLDTFKAAEAERIKRAEKLGRIRKLPNKEKEVIYPSAFRVKEGTRRIRGPIRAGGICLQFNRNGGEQEWQSVKMSS